VNARIDKADTPLIPLKNVNILDPKTFLGKIYEGKD